MCIIVLWSEAVGNRSFFCLPFVCLRFFSYLFAMKFVLWNVCLLLIFGVAFCYGQEYTPKEEARILGTQQTSGYSMEVLKSYKSVRKKWWYFLKRIGKVRLRRGYWEIYLKEGPVLFAAVAEDKQSIHSSLYLGLSAGMSEEEAEKYANELRQLLISFVVSEERVELEDRLQDYEYVLSKKSTKLERLRRRSDQLEAKGGRPGTAMIENMQALQTEINTLKKQRSEVIDRLSVLGDQYNKEK